MKTMEFRRPCSFLSNRSRPSLSRVLGRLQVQTCVFLLLISAPSFAGRWGEENWGTLVYGAAIDGRPIYVVEVLADGGGGIAWEGGGVFPDEYFEVREGDTVTISIVPDSGFETSANRITGSCGGSFDASNITFVTSPITEDCEVYVQFYRPSTSRFSGLLDSVLATLKTRASATDETPPARPAEKIDSAEGSESDVSPIPALPMAGFFILCGLVGLFGIRRLANR
ncbi:MAG: hypothetical protein VW684_13500 [Betaproteobacteria bacterium]